MSSILNISISGLNDATTRASNAASNIVNASSISVVPQNPGGTLSNFTPQDVITLSDSVGNNNLGVTSELVPRNPAYTVISDPTSPVANGQGLVAAPNVDLATEIVSLKESQVSYSANAAVIKINEKEEKALLDIQT